MQKPLHVLWLVNLHTPLGNKVKTAGLISAGGAYVRVGVSLLTYKFLEPPMTSIFEGQPLKTRPFPSKTRVICFRGVDLEGCWMVRGGYFGFKTVVHVYEGNQQLTFTISTVNLTWMSSWKLGSKIRIGSGFITTIYAIYTWLITHLLTIDPNFLGHSSRQGPTYSH